MNKQIPAIIILLLFILELCFPQQNSQFPRLYIEQLMEQAAEHYGEEADLSESIEQLEYWFEKQLNLNAASEQELKQLFILTDFQRGMLLDYRSRNGPLVSFYELLYVPGFSLREVEFLTWFTYLGELSPKSVKPEHLIKQAQHQVIFRSQRIMEPQKGYLTIPDSVPDKSRYLGSPCKLYTRYLFDAANIIQAGIVMEKDAGEDFLRGSNPYGYDFYSAHLHYRPRKSFIKDILIGDYHVNSGQGVLLWSSYSFLKTGGVSGLSPSGGLIRVNRSVDENRFLRGVAVRAGINKIAVSGFYSVKNIDATLQGDTCFVSLITTGYHNTPSELSKERTISESTYGLILRYEGNRLKIGVSGMHHAYSRYATINESLYKSFYFQGSNYTGASVDYKYLGKKYQIFGETARSYKGWASLTGAVFYMHPKLAIAALHRNYQTGYYSGWAESFREGSKVNNEKGFYLGAETELGRHRLSLYTDLFVFPWLSYRVNTPSEGYEIMFDWSVKFRNIDLIVRYKRQDKPVNHSTSDPLYLVARQIKSGFKVRGVISVSEQVNLQTRIEISSARIPNDTASQGYFLGQDMNYSLTRVPLKLSGRIAWFNASNYDNRVYVYERDVLYAGGSQMHYGKGWRFMSMIGWKVNEHLQIWCKAAQFRYPGEKVVGGGLNEINTNHRTEVKLQLKIDF